MSAAVREEDIGHGSRLCSARKTKTINNFKVGTAETAQREMATAMRTVAECRVVADRPVHRSSTSHRVRRHSSVQRRFWSDVFSVGHGIHTNRLEDRTNLKSWLRVCCDILSNYKITF